MSDWLDKLEAARMIQPKDFTLDVIPTAYTEIDEALGVNGVPRGKIIEIAGHSGSGKTALALDIVAQAQAKGLIVVYLDLDRKFDRQFAENRAVKCDDLMLFRPDPEKPENITAALKQFIGQKLVDVIVFDTISMYGESMVNILMELVKDMAGTQVTVLLASQIRNNFDDPRDYNTPFMKTLNQYSNIRMMLKVQSSIKHADVLIGKKVSVDIYKNTVAYPKSTEIELYF